MHKRCTKCGETKPRGAFSSHRGNRDGLQRHCKSCVAQHYRANADAIKATVATNRHRNRDKIEAKRRARRVLVGDVLREQKRTWYTRQPETYRFRRRKPPKTATELREQRRRVREKERQRVRRWKTRNPNAPREWQARNRERLAVYTARRRARKFAALGQGVRLQDWLQVLAEANGRCAYCASIAKLTMDHVDPLARGGAHDPENVVAACRSCNSSKGDRPLLIWLLRSAA